MLYESSETFGTNGNRVKNPYYSGPVTDHFDGTRFFNPGGVPPLGAADILRWKLRGKPARWPRRVSLPEGPVKAPPHVAGADLRVTMIGHASMLIQTDGLNVLTDPVWSRRASPFTSLGPRRVIEPGIRFQDLPQIHAVLVTHNHYDHLDLETLQRLQDEFHPIIITPLGNETLIRRTLSAAKIVSLDWGEGFSEWDGITITAEPCHHWSARGVGDRCMALWAAFVLTTSSGSIYHVGDTGFHNGINYRAAAEKYGGFRLAILPIGAYQPRWFMRGQHQDPKEAVEGFRLCRASYAIGHHFGTFRLTDEPMGEPPEQLQQALIAADIEPDRFRALNAGEVFDVPQP
ncbi:MBL fold metallo-hydrolase [Allorhizobium sp. BGMRC 0089]|uniref:MBL fold metallo-hydrolase n=1 Tax=Allorhizobium sonneratiae TaxID=2934936 RepID=UPI002033D4C4|nr:MBL fold metallo-hydrolase [Allorhizobium sonneratiae]MCM2293354.1 MBL fold metallo-hydrolase [Allorhizobium sonneratiae]